MKAVEFLQVGDHWGDASLGDIVVRVHRVDYAGDRAQVRAVTAPAPGKVWRFQRSLRAGERMTLRRPSLVRADTGEVVREPFALSCVVASAMGSQVTLTGFAVAAEYNPAPEADEEGASVQ